ncbi:MAG: hypothetical protein ACT4NX_07710 [Deltaproteobacteria bacterium]
MRKVLVTLVVFLGMASAIPAAYLATLSDGDAADKLVACSGSDKDSTPKDGGEQGTKS